MKKRHCCTSQCQVVCSFNNLSFCIYNHPRNKVLISISIIKIKVIILLLRVNGKLEALLSDSTFERLVLLHWFYYCVFLLLLPLLKPFKSWPTNVTVTGTHSNGNQNKLQQKDATLEKKWNDIKFSNRYRLLSDCIGAKTVTEKLMAV